MTGPTQGRRDCVTGRFLATYDVAEAPLCAHQDSFSSHAGVSSACLGRRKDAEEIEWDVRAIPTGVVQE